MAKTPAWLYKQSGVIPYRVDDGKIEVLLITSVRRGRWIIPKGVVERHLSPAESARKEAWEEAGVTGEISRSVVGTYQYRKWGGKCTVTVYLLKVEKTSDDWPESRMRKRRWMSIGQAAKVVADSDIGDLIREAVALITQKKH
jgi:8-oxo-dGTP pyrophosphatase MutT (NUDIX family)